MQQYQINIFGHHYLFDNREFAYSDGPEIPPDILKDPHCIAIWPWAADTRLLVWNTLIQAAALGLDTDRVDELQEKWYCDDKDAIMCAKTLGLSAEQYSHNYAVYDPFVPFVHRIIGEGPSYLWAFASLCKELGYKGGKHYNPQFGVMVRQYHDKYYTEQIKNN